MEIGMANQIAQLAGSSCCYWLPLCMGAIVAIGKALQVVNEIFMTYLCTFLFY